jgi:hypothetical protein
MLSIRNPRPPMERAMSEDNETSLPAILVGLVVIAAVLIGGFSWVMVQRNLASDAELQALQAMEEFRSRTAILTLWRDSKKVEDVKKAKMLCEEKVGLVKRKGEPQSREEKSARAIGKDLYGKAKKSSDSCINYLIAGIARQFDKPDDYAEIKRRMEESDNAMRQVSGWVNYELNREESDIRESDINRTSDNTLDRIPRWVDKFKTIKHSDEELAQIKAELEKCRLKDWNEIE